MALVGGKVGTTKEEYEKLESGKKVMVPMRVYTRTYDCRPQVLERAKWKKFGEVAGVERGQHYRGDFGEDVTLKIITHDAEVREDIELVKQFKTFNTQTVKANQQLRDLEKL